MKDRNQYLALTKHHVIKADMKSRVLLRVAFAVPSEKSTWCRGTEGCLDHRHSVIEEKFLFLLRIEHL